MKIYGKENDMVTIEENALPLEKQAEAEKTASRAARSKAVEDYNIMMGNLEDPSEEEDEEDE